MPASGSLFYIAIFLLVVFRVANRAYAAYSNGYKTWPILAVLGVLYVALYVIRLAMHIVSPTFTFISFGIWALSVLIFKFSGANPDLAAAKSQSYGRPDSLGTWPNSPTITPQQPSTQQQAQFPASIEAAPTTTPRQAAEESLPPWAKPS